MKIRPSSLWLVSLSFGLALCREALAQVPSSYTPTAGTGLTLNIAAGTALCGSPPSPTNYAGGALTMAASATNYVYLDPTQTGAPAYGPATVWRWGSCWFLPGQGAAGEENPERLRAPTRLHSRQPTRRPTSAIRPRSC